MHEPLTYQGIIDHMSIQISTVLIKAASIAMYLMQTSKPVLGGAIKIYIVQILFHACRIVVHLLIFRNALL